ncbi:EamA family transporter, partial [Flavobacteriaceae bacterium]|nr:EamA family transporter [Flavobacteriaceae bacterium]
PSIDIKMYYDFKIIALSVLSSAAVILFFYSYTLVEVYKVNLISNFHPIGGLLISMIFFKEKLAFLQWCGVVFSVMTCVLI